MKDQEKNDQHGRKGQSPLGALADEHSKSHISMSKNTNDEIIDLMLSKLYEHHPDQIILSPLFEDLGFEDFDYIDFQEMIADEGLAKYVEQDSMRLTRFGRQVSKNGGWLKHLEIRANKQRTSVLKLRHDARLSQWKVITFWPVIFGSLIGGLFGAVSLVLELEGRGYISTPINLRKTQPERTETSITANPTNQIVHSPTSDTLK